MSVSVSQQVIQALRQQFGPALQENARMAGFTTARVGGPVDALLVVQSADELAQAAAMLWQFDTPFIVLGSGSNILVSDEGLHEVVLLNRARAISFDMSQPSVWAESGANFGTIARQASLHGLSGLEWAATIPGTLGGAVYGNAGAYGSDMSSNLLLAEILHPVNQQAENEGQIGNKQTLTAQQMGYQYRTSVLKQGQSPRAVILSARLQLQKSDPASVKAKMGANAEHRRRTQPPGASMGSMFKNPPGDYAGRLIEAAGMKGTRIGNAEISDRHANFFVNHGEASASDVGLLIAQARAAVAQQFGILLELEIELLGEWPMIENAMKEKHQGE